MAHYGGLSAQAHVIVKRTIVRVSRAPGHGCLFFGGCPEEGSVGPSTLLRAVSLSNGDPVKTACFRRILRARAINDASLFHGGQSCLLCRGTAKKDTHTLELDVTLATINSGEDIAFSARRLERRSRRAGCAFPFFPHEWCRIRTDVMPAPSVLPSR